MNAHHRWRRGDGTVLSCVDLNQAVPMLLGELDDIVRLIDLIEEWLRMDDLARDQLSQWRLAIADVCTGPDRPGPSSTSWAPSASRCTASCGPASPTPATSTHQPTDPALTTHRPRARQTLTTLPGNRHAAARGHQHQPIERNRRHE